MSSAASMIGWRAPAWPAHEAIAGRLALLEPLDPSRHLPDLETAFAGADGAWTYLPPDPPQDFDAWIALLGGVLIYPNSQAYAVRDRARGAVTGFLSLLNIRPGDGVAEIGYVAFSPLLQRTPAATESVYLLLRLLFEAGYRRVEWKCDVANQASRKAAERFGFVYEGLFRQHMVRKRRNRDTAWYALLDGDWPERRAAFEAWLAPDNFDAAGRQKQPLRRRPETAPAD